MLVKNIKPKALLSLLTGLLTLSVVHGVMSAVPAQDPLFLSQPVRPVMMLNMSNDHQLFFSLYDDYSDLTGNGVLDRTYAHNYAYYGYFDSGKCYSYSTTDSQFEPSRPTDDDGYCNHGAGSSEWSGNFLNWASMTRMDAVRKILYGGMRSTDTATETVLERAFLPQDAHSFAKYYNGSDISRLTPFSPAVTGQATNTSGITICNTTDPGDETLSQNVTNPPLMKVAEGNYSLWAGNEGRQCRWDVDGNANLPASSGIPAHDSSPEREDVGLGEQDYVVRVQVCVLGHIDTANNNEGCREYGDNRKPAGLLQEYGENNSIHFGLITGSYARNKSGGVLRKNVGGMSDEIRANGTFIVPTANQVGSFNGIIRTLDLLRTYGYRYDGSSYHRNLHEFDSAGSDGCVWTFSSFSDGHCSNWGNPQSEIYLESLNYLAGLTATSGYYADDSSYIAGLNTAAWTRPITNENYCAPLSIIQFNASTNSYDRDPADLSASGIGVASVAAATNLVGENEGIHGNTYFVGAAGGTDDDQLCTAKTVSRLADVHGTCPDAPRLEGGYHIAGLAYHARKEGIPLTGVTQGPRQQTVTTYGVALAPAVPRVEIPVPGAQGQSVTILPACRNNDARLPDQSVEPSGDNTILPANCAIVDFKVVNQEFGVIVNGATANTGKLYVNWEDSEQGGDFDQDMWGVIDYAVTGTTVSVTTQVIAQSTPDAMGFGYVISGTTTDGFHVHSGINGFTYTSPYPGLFSCTSEGASQCTCRNAAGTHGPCDHPQRGARTQTYTIGTTTAELLESPLYYAAKWGGYADDNATISEIAAVDEPPTYFYATDPRKLEESLRAAFASVAASVGSASAVAANSTRLEEDAFIYQARFNSDDWSGEIRAFAVDGQGNISDEHVISTHDSNVGQASDIGRTVYTYNGSALVSFEWSNLNDTQRNLLSDGDSGDVGRDRLDWLRGSDAKEGDGMRRRAHLLGDIVNSSPVYLGGRDMRYGLLPGEEGAAYAAYLVEKRAKDPVLFVGANDGMLHAFHADGENMLREIFAYVPATVYPKLARLTATDYGLTGNPHQYLVDGPLAVGDAYVNGNWRSVLVGTLGGGGKGVFALDVTNINSPQVLFELDAADVGYVMGRPFIRRMQDGTWAAIFGNGYDSAESSLLVVDLATGVPRTLGTGEGSGLSDIELLLDNRGVVMAAYGGDLHGNLWKFDLKSTNAGSWEVAYNGQPLFQAKDSEGRVQAITGAPTLGINQQRGGQIMVYFGTGKYFEVNDQFADSTNAEQSVYGIVDAGPIEYTNGTRSNVLHKKALLVDEDGRRSVDNDQNVDWTTNIAGWHFDLDSSLNIDRGERVITKPLLLYDKVIFSTIIPSAVPCEYGGRSWIMELAAVGDKYVNQSVLDDFESKSTLILNDPTVGYLPQTTSEGEGDDDENGELPEPLCEGGLRPAAIVTSLSDGTIATEVICLPSTALGRQSWRQLR